MRRHFPLACLAGSILLGVLAGCDGLREKEPDPEPKEPGPLVVRKRIICEGHQGTVGSVAVSPDGKLVASGSDDGTLRLWDAADGALLRTVRPAKPPDSSTWVGALSFSPDGKILAASISCRRLEFYEAATGKPAQGMPELHERPHCTAFSPDGKAIAVGSRYGVRVWRLSTGDKMFDFRYIQPNGRPGMSAERVCFSPSGRYFAAGLCGRSDSVFLSKGPQMRGAFRSPGPQLRVWELGSGKEIFSARDARGDVKSLSFSPDGRLLAVDATQLESEDDLTEAGHVEVYDWARDRRVGRFRANESGTDCMSWSPDGALFTGSSDGVVRRWAATGKPAGALDWHTGLVRDLPVPKAAADAELTYEPRNGPPPDLHWIRDLALSRNGKVLVSGAHDKRVTIWHFGGP